MDLDEAVKRVEREWKAAEDESLVIHEAIKAYRANNDMAPATLEDIDAQTLEVKVLMVGPN